MKIYVVTSGCYSDYHIDAVFTDAVMADQYANLDSDRNVETYEADSASVTNRSDDLVLYVAYDFENDIIESMHLTNDENKEVELASYHPIFYFYLIPSGPVYEDIKANGNESKLLLKAAQDRFYCYLGLREISREELIKEINDKREKDRELYRPYTTSSVSLEWKQFTMANEQCSQILHQLIEGGVQLPSATELQNMREGIISDILLKGEENNEQN